MLLVWTTSEGIKLRRRIQAYAEFANSFMLVIMVELRSFSLLSFFSPNLKNFPLKAKYLL
jgi:hypothetical protein